MVSNKNRKTEQQKRRIKNDFGLLFLANKAIWYRKAKKHWELQPSEIMIAIAKGRANESSREREWVNSV